MKGTRWWTGWLLLLAGLGLAGAAAAAEPSRFSGPRLGLAAYVGGSYDPPGQRRFYLVSASALYPYQRIMGHPAPQTLRFKFEADAGLATVPQTRTMAALGIMAQFAPDRWGGPGWRPYAEAGIGVIYTDFRVPGQGLRLNFNPRLGLGVELDDGDGPRWYAAVRAHHVSNGHLYHANRGINSVLLQVGRYF